LELFLTGLLGQLGTQLGDHSHHPPTKREEVFFPAMAEAALRLLKATPTDDAPDAAIDALLRIGNRREPGSGVRKTANEALVELHRTAERRRRAFWWVVRTLRIVSPRQRIDQFWHIELLGYRTGLKIEDVEWLLADGLAKGEVDCRLAVAAALWRACAPLVRSRRAPQERNSVRWLDLMGLTGVTLEATKDPAWATKLSNEEAGRATEFATLEINGFPRWLSDLVASRPAEVRTVLHHEIKDELTREGVTFFETLQAVAYSDDGLASLVAPALLQDLEATLEVPQGAVSLVLQIIVNGLAESDRERFERWGIAKFEQQPDVARTVPDLSAVFSNCMAVTPDRMPLPSTAATRMEPFAGSGTRSR
jgi:hypothetical protein